MGYLRDHPDYMQLNSDVRVLKDVVSDMGTEMNMFWFLADTSRGRTPGNADLQVLLDTQQDVR